MGEGSKYLFEMTFCLEFRPNWFDSLIQSKYVICKNLVNMQCLEEENVRFLIIPYLALTS